MFFACFVTFKHIWVGKHFVTNFAEQVILVVCLVLILATLYHSNHIFPAIQTPGFPFLVESFLNLLFDFTLEVYQWLCLFVEICEILDQTQQIFTILVHLFRFQRQVGLYLRYIFQPTQIVVWHIKLPTNTLKSFYVFEFQKLRIQIQIFAHAFFWGEKGFALLYDLRDVFIKHGVFICLCFIFLHHLIFDFWILKNLDDMLVKISKNLRLLILTGKPHYLIFHLVKLDTRIRLSIIISSINQRRPRLDLAQQLSNQNITDNLLFLELFLVGDRLAKGFFQKFDFKKCRPNLFKNILSIVHFYYISNSVKLNNFG